MKKLSKILCAVLVLAMLCSSLIFVVGAEEETPAFTSVPASTDDALAAVKYSATDNLISYISRSSNALNGWNGEGARQAHVVTNTKTGESWYREWFEGDEIILKNGHETGSEGNEYIQFNFTKQTLAYEAGYNEYIVIDFDLAYKANSANIWYKDKMAATSNMKMEVIPRGDVGTTWTTVQNFKDFGLGDSMMHVTAVYDYTSANAYIFVNGKLANTVANGAFTDASHAKYLAGTSATVQEWRIGSNSADEFHMANAYVRYTKSASAEDTLANAIAFGTLSRWNDNIYNDDYVVPTPYWFVPTVEYTDLGIAGNLGNNAVNVVKATAPGNLVTKVSRSNVPAEGAALANNGAYFNTYLANYPGDPYYMFVANQDYVAPAAGSAANNNPFIGIDITHTEFSIASGTKALYVFDIDLASNSDMLDETTFELEFRRVSDGTGFPFGKPYGDIKLAHLVDKDSEWSHLTFVGDVAANQLHAFVNGEYYGVVGVAYEKSQAGTDTVLKAKSARLAIATNDVASTVSKGQSLAFDNIAERIYANGNESLAAALASRDITAWDGYFSGRQEQALPTVATVNGVAYSNVHLLQNALTSNYKLDVEFLSTPVYPVTVKANATINTNGMDLSKLVTFGPECSTPVVDGNLVTVTHPFVVTNKEVNQVTVPGGAVMNDIYNAIKYDVDGNLFKNFTPISLQVGGKYQPTWGNAGFRNAELVTNLETGEVYYRESSVLLPDGTMAEGLVLDANNNLVSFKEADKGNNTFVRSNEYVNLNFNSVNLTYEANKTEYIVVDFDLGLDAGAVTDSLSFQLIPRINGSGAWATDILIKDIPMELNKMAHITVVANYSTNEAYVFVNGVYTHTVAGGAMNSGKWTNDYKAGKTFAIAEFKLCSDRKVSTICLDNVAMRAYDVANANDPIAAAVNAGDITRWSGSIYNANYKTTQFPSVATVDGVPCGSTVADLNAALAVETGSVKNVVLNRPVDETIVVKTEANVETFGLDVNFNYETGLYKFNPGKAELCCTGTDYAYASRRLVLVHNAGDTLYKFENINASNCKSVASYANWISKFDFETGEMEYDVVFYVYGDEMAPVVDHSYIYNGKLHADQWYNMSTEGEIGGLLDSYVVAAGNIEFNNYFLASVVTDADFVASDLKQTANVSTNGQITLLVNKSETVTEGEVVLVDGVEYVALTFTFAPTEITKVFTAEFYVEDENGNVYLQKQDVSFVSYAEKLLASEDQSASTKNVVLSMLQYANQANALFNGETFDNVDALLNTYAAQLPEADHSEVKDTVALSEVIRSAAMKLGNTPEFLFKVVRGFKGTIEFSYTGVNGAVKVTKDDVDATASDVFVTLDGFNVCDINADITIIATAEGKAPVSGVYNLSTYAAGLENAGFANALVAYAQASKVYYETYKLYNDGKLNVTVVDSLSADNNLNTVVAGKIKQMDQATLSPSNDTYGWFTKEGGTPVYVLVPQGDQLVEALYFSRDVKYDWTTYSSKDQNSGYVEHRYTLDSSRTVVSISFDYVINGTVESHSTAGEGVFQVKNTAGKYIDVIFGNATYDEDGNWHNIKWDNTDGLALTDVLVKFYHFNGEFVIANLVVEYAD